MTKTLPKTINLLEPTFEPKNTWDKIYDWVFAVGRYIIVGVELVVILAFFSRFYLDVKNNDLKDSMEAKVLALDEQASNERKLRRIENSLVNLSLILENQELKSSDIEDALDKIPSGVTLDSFTISEDSLLMACHASSYDPIKKLENNLRLDPVYSNVDVSLAKEGGEGAEIKFNVIATYDR
ncbi:hypothetical protein JW887_02105 [Candidatus Dojkabacteria bacterium]|nr:hypothetical protein [Candidatus Dojkabacteria bacterium]